MKKKKERKNGASIQQVVLLRHMFRKRALAIPGCSSRKEQFVEYKRDQERRKTSTG